MISKKKVEIIEIMEIMEFLDLDNTSRLKETLSGEGRVAVFPKTNLNSAPDSWEPAK